MEGDVLDNVIIVDVEDLFRKHIATPKPRFAVST